MTKKVVKKVNGTKKAIKSHYCTKCGKRLKIDTYTESYSAMSGKPIKEEIRYCPTMKESVSSWVENGARCPSMFLAPMNLSGHDYHLYSTKR